MRWAHSGKSYWRAIEAAWDTEPTPYNRADVAVRVILARLATKPDEDGWREPASKWLEQEAERRTNSLHCGDNYITIHRTHNSASALKLAARIIRALSTTGEPKR